MSRDPANQSQHDDQQFRAIADLFTDDTWTQLNLRDLPDHKPIEIPDALDAFPRYASRQSLARFLTHYEIFRHHILPIHGSIVECGVLNGSSLFTWAKLSSIFEPANHTRRIIGFDTFSGFPSIHDKDQGTTFKQGDLQGLSLERMQAAVEAYDVNRPLSHISKIELVAGDLATTAAAYVAKNPHLVVAALHLDVDLYEPTLAALEAFVPLMPRGAVIILDETSYVGFPGESVALKKYWKPYECLPRLQRFPWTSTTCFAVLE